MNYINATLRLFGGVECRRSNKEIKLNSNRIIFLPGTEWAKEDIIEYVQEYCQVDLNSTLFENWKVIRNMCTEDYIYHQTLHYIANYVWDTPYIPAKYTTSQGEELDVKLYKVESFTKKQLQEKCTELLSGKALSKRDIDDIITIFEQIDFPKLNANDIPNKEARCILALKYGLRLKNPEDELRKLVYAATDNSLLIKSSDVIQMLRNFESKSIIQETFYGYEDDFAPIFNRYKPLFLAMKKHCPDAINRISKRSKKLHKPMPVVPMNNVNTRLLSEIEVRKATTQQILRGLAAISDASKSDRIKIFKIRNGKSWTQKSKTKTNPDIRYKNWDLLLNELRSRNKWVYGKTFVIDKNVAYGLPVSTKSMLGVLPNGTKIRMKRPQVGVYWKNDWGAQDLDLSAVSEAGKIGWNSMHDKMRYSGDIVNAPDGATEWIAVRDYTDPMLFLCNVYSGEQNTEFNFLFGKECKHGEEMMTSKNLIVNTHDTTKERSVVFGAMIPSGNKHEFVVYYTGAGDFQVSGVSELADLQREAIVQTKDSLSLNQIIDLLGGKIVHKVEEDTVDLRIQSLQKDTLINLLK